MKKLSQKRWRMLQASIALCALALLLLPLAARSAKGVPADDADFKPIEVRTPPPAVTPFPRIYVERDPFAAPREIASDASPIQTRLTIRAIASGATQSAIVEEDGRTRLVSLGDRVDGSVVITIDAAGIALANGVRIRIGDSRR